MSFLPQFAELDFAEEPEPVRPGEESYIDVRNFIRTKTHKLAPWVYMLDAGKECEIVSTLQPSVLPEEGSKSYARYVNGSGILDYRKLLSAAAPPPPRHVSRERVYPEIPATKTHLASKRRPPAANPELRPAHNFIFVNEADVGKLKLDKILGDAYKEDDELGRLIDKKRSEREELTSIACELDRSMQYSGKQAVKKRPWPAENIEASYSSYRKEVTEEARESINDYLGLKREMRRTRKTVHRQLQKKQLELKDLNLQIFKKQVRQAKQSSLLNRSVNRQASPAPKKKPSPVRIELHTALPEMKKLQPLPSSLNGLLPSSSLLNRQSTMTRLSSFSRTRRDSTISRRSKTLLDPPEFNPSKFRQFCKRYLNNQSKREYFIHKVNSMHKDSTLPELPRMIRKGLVQPDFNAFTVVKGLVEPLLENKPVQPPNHSSAIT